MAVEYQPSRIPGVGLLVAPWLADARGSFTKPFSAELLAAADLTFDIAEVYWSSSSVGVVRGMHFQLPPTAVVKLVFVVTGAVRDVVFDMRTGSPTEGQSIDCVLTPGSGVMVIPVGCAHGFEVLEGPAAMCYLQDGPFDPATDAGLRWDSIDAPWATTDPVLSQRDAGLPTWSGFHSPFAWRTQA